MNTEATLALEYLATVELFRDLSSDELGEVMALARVSCGSPSVLLADLQPRLRELLNGPS